MTTNIPQTSASDRYEAARKALAYWEGECDPLTAANLLADALRALITPPSVGIDAQVEAAERIAAQVERRAGGQISLGGMLYAAADRGFLAGIQSAHETWEPEVAQRPSQEQMLRWLGLEYGETAEGEPSFYVPFQYIEREEI